MAAQELSARTATPPVVEAPRPLVFELDDIVNAGHGFSFSWRQTRRAYRQKRDSARRRQKSMPGTRESIPNFAAPAAYRGPFKAPRVVANDREIV